MGYTENGGGGIGTSAPIEVFNCTATEQIGDAIFVFGADSVRQANASNMSTMKVVGIISEKLTTTTVRIILSGEVTGFTGLTPGATYYASTTPGQLSTIPSLIEQEVGVAIDANTLFLNPQEIEAPQGIYGTHFQKAESSIVSISTVTGWLPKVTLNTTSLPAGTYRIRWSYGWAYNDGTTDFGARLILDGVDTSVDDYLMYHNQEVQEMGGTGLGRFSGVGTDQAYTNSGTYFKTFGTQATHTLALDWRSGVTNTEASIWDASIEIVRVA